MWQSLKFIFEWGDSLKVGKAISGTIWMFPVIETIHILALTVMFGSLIIVDLRLLGLGMRRQSVSTLAKSLNPYIVSGMLVMLGTGFLLFSSEAMKCFINDGFKFKMEVLVPAIIFQFTAYRWATKQDHAQKSPIVGGIVSLLSLALWFGVGVGGRAIGFV